MTDEPGNPSGSIRGRALLAAAVVAVVLWCAPARGRGPTLVAVDFAERGALLPIVDELNGE